MKPVDEAAKVVRRIEKAPPAYRESIRAYVAARRAPGAREVDKTRWTTVLNDLSVIIPWSHHLNETSTSFEDAKEGHARDFIAKAELAKSEGGLGWARTTVSTIMVRLDQFYKFMADPDAYRAGGPKRKRIARHDATRWWADNPGELPVATMRDYEPSDMLTPQEIARVKRMARGHRERGIMAVICETGFRAGEVIALNISSVEFLTGSRARLTLPTQSRKSGRYKTKYSQRSVEVRWGVAELMEVIDHHELRDLAEVRPDLNIPLFTATRASHYHSGVWAKIDQEIRSSVNGSHERLVSQEDLEDLRASRDVLTRTFAPVVRRAGINKRYSVTVHLFRHSLATWFVSLGLSDRLMKARFGWAPSSAMVENYAHLSTEAVSSAFAKAMGFDVDAELAEAKDAVRALGDRRCTHCGELTSQSRPFCQHCQAPLDRALLRSSSIARDAMQRLGGDPKRIVEESAELAGRVAQHHGYLDPNKRLTQRGADALRAAEARGKLAATRARQRKMKKDGICLHEASAAAGEKFCRECGAEMCQHSNAQGSKFCPECGVRVSLLN